MRVSRAVVGVVAGALLLAGCGSSAPPEPVTVTLYNAQHEDLAQEWVQDFTARTGVRVEMRNGDDSELANQIVAEGAASPADVFITENSPAMSLVSDRGLFAPLEPATLEQVPPEFRSAQGDWAGIAARSTVLVYNRTLLPADQLPRSIMDLAGPEWQGRVGFPPGGADFQAIVSAVAATRGEAATQQWLQGLKNNGRLYQSNTATMRAVNAGEIPAGIIYHYYWSKDRAEAGANSAAAELHHFGGEDPGAFLSTSGGGVLRSSDTPAEAQMLVRYLNGPDGQRVLANSTALEYTVNPAVPSNPRLRPIAELGAPPVDINSLDGPRSVAMMQQAGLL
ncbi:MAG: Ferric iron ABC transporter, iron-binding protein [uncultured Actinomycetospora sp.]|uniref:Ferric iron ABC transporter, iron-binding protein n=1 Tax=uncultured Actinomycetospora sp. TaxID=1135996 RepID=A0A6J4JJ49_9PSEU|nr:MAG: Ferric iron ABC transporter, iron-binding protein [uncultured Actinomycetospora sp.]